jgi:hypothetical protein
VSGWFSSTDDAFDTYLPAVADRSIVTRKKLKYFLPPFICEDANPSSIWSEIGQVAADTVGVDSQNR